MVDFGEVFLGAVCVELILVATCSLVKKNLLGFCTSCIFKTYLKSVIENIFGKRIWSEIG